jgi:Nif-specific regulatory protein
MKIENKNSNIISETLIDLARLLGEQNEFEEILRLISQKTSHLLQAELTLIMMINPKTRQTIKTVFSEGEKTKEQKYHTLNTSVSGWVIKNETPLISKDIQSDSRFRQSVFKDIPVKSALCVPLRSENLIFGTLSLFRKIDTDVLSNSDLSYLEKIAIIVSPFVRNVQKIEHYFKQQMPEQTILRKYQEHGLLGKSKSFVELLRAIEAAAGSDTRVLLQGKSGTGKELVAKAIHDFSKRNAHKFVAIDCGAISENLIESELFGHVKGAFTGAMTSRTGLFEEANNGTLFMDEISNLPMELQAKLLRVLQENEIRPLGSNTTRQVNVRIISASSEPLKELVNKQKFREDLFYRLMVYPVIIPSLEERQADIPLLANHFIKLYAMQQNKQVKRFDESIIDFIKHHDWTGNIRELENFMERMVTLASKNQTQIDIGLLPPEFRDELKSLVKNKKKVQETRSLTEILNMQEKQIIHQTLVDHKWNQSSAANALGIDESTLRYKMKKFGIKKGK